RDLDVLVGRGGDFFALLVKRGGAVAIDDRLGEDRSALSALADGAKVEMADLRAFAQQGTVGAFFARRPIRLVIGGNHDIHIADVEILLGWKQGFDAETADAFAP